MRLTVIWLLQLDLLAVEKDPFGSDQSIAQFSGRPIYDDAALDYPSFDLTPRAEPGSS
jgi:hypothetical protein